MEEAFTKIVSQILNNWTALKLAVDHSMGGPHSKQVAIDFKDSLVQYCVSEPNLEIEDIQDEIEDMLDQNFNTVCEDGSPKEISQLLYMFLKLLKEGKTAECEVEFLKLPSVNSDWLSEQSRPNQMVDESSSDESSEGEVAMEQDEWTVVKGRRKK